MCLSFDVLIRLSMGAALMAAASREAVDQPQAPVPAVEVASVKTMQGDLPPTGGTLTTSGPRITFHGFRLSGLLWFAYNVRQDQISSPSPLDKTMYDVEIIAQGGLALTRDEFRPLVQSVLVDRFKLRAHRETRQTQAYALVVGKNGSKLKVSPPDSQVTRNVSNDRSPNYHSVISRITANELAGYISQNAFLDLPVVDQTGLTGTYALDLTYSPENRIRSSGYNPDMISIFTAVKDQLGLELVRRNVPFEMLVIDQVEKPSQN